MLSVGGVAVSELAQTRCNQSGTEASFLFWVFTEGGVEVAVWVSEGLVPDCVQFSELSLVA